ncbi:MAG: phage major capsid protein, partial [Firmicutes bacterium]|nr:phage major capsid protein [Bacillota bacterium]
MTKLAEMIRKRSEAFEAAKNFASSHATDKGTLTDEDYKTYEAMEKEIENYSREISRMQREENMEKELSKAVNSPLTSRPYREKKEEKKDFRATDEYKAAMLDALRSNFRMVSNVLQEGVDVDGGYLVPVEYDNRLIDVLDEENVMRQLATKITTSGEHKINIAATKPAAAWIDEGDPLTFGDAKFDQKNLDAFKLYVAVKVTEELLYDNAFGLENYLMTQFGKALANAEEDAFLNGSGSGRPTGIFDATNGGTITTSTAAKITTDNLLEL